MARERPAPTVWAEHLVEERGRRDAEHLAREPGLMILTPLLAATTVDALTFAVAAAIVLAGAIGVVVARNPGALRADARHDAVRRGGHLRRAPGELPRRRPGHRLRGRHRRAVPVRDHVSRRRPSGEPRDRALAGPATPRRGPRGAGSRRRARSRDSTRTGRSGRNRSPVRPNQSGGDVAALGRSVFTTYLFAVRGDLRAARDRRGGRGRPRPAVPAAPSRRRAGPDADADAAEPSHPGTGGGRRERHGGAGAASRRAGARRPPEPTRSDEEVCR